MTQTSKQHHMRRVIALGVGVVTIGVLGFMIIEGWSFEDALYMVIITLTTIGYQEAQVLSDTGRWFNMVFILSGLGIVLYAISYIWAFVVEWGVKQFLISHYTSNKIKKMNNHYILCGLGSVGKQIIEELRQNGNDVCVIDTDIDQKNYCNKEELLFIEGDASDEEVLKQAGVDKAKGLIAATGSDATNVFIVLSARHANKDLFIVARANEKNSLSKLRQAGADKSSLAHRISGYHMATMVEHPSVIDFLDILTNSSTHSFRIEEVYIREQSSVANTTIKAFFDQTESNISVLAIFKGSADNYIMNPKDDHIIVPGDRLIVMGGREDLDTVLDRIEKPKTE